MRIAVCDDNKDELVYITSILDTYIQERNAPIVYKAFYSATELLSTAKSGTYDLYLLDLLMPTVSGMDAAREIRSFDRLAKIAFLTSSPEFAIESYDVKACNYILKPVSRETLFFALDGIVEAANVENEGAIVVKSSEGVARVLLSHLTHVEVLERKVLYYISSGKVLECTSGFCDVCEELLSHSEFIQPHRCYVVNMGYISNIKSTEIILQSGTSLPISKRRASEIKERYLSFQMEG